MEVVIIVVLTVVRAVIAWQWIFTTLITITEIENSIMLVSVLMLIAMITEVIIKITICDNYSVNECTLIFSVVSNLWVLL